MVRDGLLINGGDVLVGVVALESQMVAVESVLGLRGRLPLVGPYEFVFPVLDRLAVRAYLLNVVETDPEASDTCEKFDTVLSMSYARVPLFVITESELKFRL